MMRFNKPQIANAHTLTNDSLKYDPNQPVYVHVDWLAPGRHTYCISHDEREVSDKEQIEAPIKSRRFSILFGKKPDKQKFYVHDLLSTYRDEPIPHYYNARHSHRIKNALD